MDELKQFNVVESSATQDTLMEEKIMEPPKKSKFTSIALMIAIFLGLGTGYYVAQRQLMAGESGQPGAMAGTQALTSDTTIKVGDVFGSADEKTFGDEAEGILMAGGIDGEGSHHIERGDNKSQWVYVTSSVVDLDLLIGNRVIVWGETNLGKKAGWLMDVGRLKVVELGVAPADVNAVDVE